MAITLLVSLPLSGLLSRRYGVPRQVAWLLVASIGLILAATLTPQREALAFGATSSGTCNLSRIGFASLSAYLERDDVGGNVVLFVPLGVGVALASRPRIRPILLDGALLLPVVIETIQLLVRALDRACESADVFDNLLGLFIGLAVGGVIVHAIRAQRG
jgi:glycopeptide antibiotics resistance protein